jgi:hypothetical protein
MQRTMIAVCTSQTPRTAFGRFVVANAQKVSPGKHILQTWPMTLFQVRRQTLFDGAPYVAKNPYQLSEAT